MIKRVFYRIFGGVTARFLRANISYSQGGEDIILESVFWDRKKGFYIDIGAHHPIRFSNTYKFYIRGWRGINIDAMPGSMNKFNKDRCRDINIEAAIFDADKTLTYYGFNEPALNGFSAELSNLRNGHDHYKIIFKKEIKTQRLSKLLNEVIPYDIEIDFLSVDVEGLDLNVLKSNDWEKYRPKVIVVEIAELKVLDISEIKNNETVNFLKGIDYHFFAKTHTSCCFIDKRISSN